MKPTMLDIIPLLDEFKLDESNLVGGNLHIDYNISDSDIIFCLNKCIEHNDELGKKICEISLNMSKTQRRKVCRHFYKGVTNDK